MAVKQSVLIASFVLLVIFVNQGTAIHCFECNSHYNESCDADIVPDRYKIDCRSLPAISRDSSQQSISYTFCRKIKQIIEFSVNKLPADTRIVRSCGYDKRSDESDQNQCYKRHGFGGRQIVCSCNNGDYCNNSNILKNTSVFLTIFGAIAMLLSQ